MYELTNDSAWVEEGKLYREDGVLIERPAILVYSGVMVRVGEYNNLFKEMLEIESNKGIEFESDVLHLLNLTKYPMEYFDIEDACYVVRRCCEFVDSEFTKDMVDKYGDIGFIEWFEEEKLRFPIQTRKA